MTPSEVLFTLSVLLVVTFVYWVSWRLYLLLTAKFLIGFDFWKKTPEFIQRPKFWQFVLIAFAYFFVTYKIRNFLK